MRRKNTDKRPAATAVRHIMAAFKNEGHKVQRHEDGFTLIRPMLSTRVTVSESDADYAHLVENVIRIETRLPEIVEENGDEVLALLNNSALFSAAARRSDGTIAAMSTWPVPAGDSVVVDEHLLSLVIAFQIPSFTAAARDAMTAQQGGTRDVLTHGDEPSKWTQADLEQAAASLDQDTTVDSHTLGITFPWKDRDGATINAYGGMRIGEHPVFGNGLRFTFVPPVNYEPKALPEVVRQLNVAEYIEDIAAPQLGAWCMTPEPRFTFVGFVPNLLYQPHLATSVAEWLAHRSRWTRDFLLGD